MAADSQETENLIKKTSHSDEEVEYNYLRPFDSVYSYSVNLLSKKSKKNKKNKKNKSFKL